MGPSAEVLQVLVVLLTCRVEQMYLWSSGLFVSGPMQGMWKGERDGAGLVLGGRAVSEVAEGELRRIASL